MRSAPSQKKDSFDVSLFFGLNGLLSFVVVLPLVFALHVTGVQPFEFPAQSVWFFLTLRAVIGNVVNDFFFGKTLEHLGSFLTTIGLSLNIPLGKLVDSWYGEDVWSHSQIIGTLLVLSGLFSITALERNRVAGTSNKSNYSENSVKQD